MKKIFTLISMALVAMSANAQTDVKTAIYAVPADFDLTEYHKIIEAKDATSGEQIGTVEILSSPNKDQLFTELKDESGEKILDAEGKPQFDESKPKTAWEMKVKETATNMSLDALVPGLNNCIIGKGNPVMSQDEGWEKNADGDWTYKVTNAVYWTPKCGELPKQGAYIKVTPNEDGAVQVGVYINKGGGVNGTGHQLYIIDESTKEAGYDVLGSDKVKVTGYFNNNTWIPDDTKQVYNATTEAWENAKDENGENIKYYPFGQELPLNLTLSDDYSIFSYTAQDQGTTKRLDRVFIGTVSFEVKKDVTYWMLNPTSQLGFYGFKLYVNGTLDDVGTGIDAVKNAKNDNASAPIYNMAGQRVNKSYKGVVIQNGRKFVNK